MTHLYQLLTQETKNSSSDEVDLAFSTCGQYNLAWLCREEPEHHLSDQNLHIILRIKI